MIVLISTYYRHIDKVQATCNLTHQYLFGVWISTGFTIQFDNDYHVNDSIQFDITMHHDYI